MLKKRIAASLVVKDGIVVQSINFRKYMPVGKPAIAIAMANGILLTNPDYETKCCPGVIVIVGSK